MTCVLHGNLQFSHLLYKLGSTHFLIYNFSVLVLRNLIYFFHLDKQHPCWLEILPMAELRISSFLPLSLKCPRVHFMWMWVYSRGPPFLPIPTAGLNFLTDGTLIAWPYFPGFKVGKSPILPIWMFVGVGYKSLPSTITPKLCGYWLELFSLAVLVDSVRVH
jgi:hypothetical protein